MKLNSVSMRRWAGWGALQCSCIALLHFRFSCLWMAVWLWTGLMMDRPHLSVYSHKTGPLRESARAFLVYTVYIASAALLCRLLSELIVHPFLLRMAIFSVPLWAQLFADRFFYFLLSPRLCLFIGGMLLCVFLLLC